MKGISHFAAGVAAASFFPAAVEAGARGNPLYFILGGVFGLLPDTLDFKVYRFLYRREIEVGPDPLAPDAQAIADAVANAANDAHETGKAVRIKLNTVPMGADLWQQYEVGFDVPKSEVVVRYGPVVTTSQTPAPGHAVPRVAVGRAGLLCPLRLDYAAVTTVDIFDGPLFRMTPDADGRVRPEFIPWHRQWTHSLVIGLVCAAACALLWGWLAGAVVMCAYSAHALMDQLGFMGSNLLFPFGSRRLPGLRAMHSGEALPNLVSVWLCGALVFWNLCRLTPGLARPPSSAKVLFYGLGVPAALVLLRRILAARKPMAAAEGGKP